MAKFTQKDVDTLNKWKTDVTKEDINELLEEIKNYPKNMLLKETHSYLTGVLDVNPLLRYIK